ncbi:MAG: 2-oxoglutarate dehydrogenase E1 component [Candidatus Latescibacterota bacterium]|nr:2-oxoglutarate dehydrogenase E1 component [Candidatus Latescibacterota bacterium]MEE2626893.1 2-oxoglutarate dehydrogenase E1 component [Candidatus Latescibacterota bacterium]MEE2728395.1 2-oxoglutarate dehydrogenase E1 component [Candidatus Latescibacterota bacterium]
MPQFDSHSENAEFVDRLYRQYLQDPTSLDGEWRAFFKGFELGFLRAEDVDTQAEPAGDVPDRRYRQRTDRGVFALVQAYRTLGHFIAQLDPLGHNRDSIPLLELSEFGLSDEDLEKGVGQGGFLGETDGSLQGLIGRLKDTYCGNIGVEYMDIPDKEQRAWLQERIEPCFNRHAFSEDEMRHLLSRLVEAEEFEQFLHTRYIGQKRFSLEGGESLIPLLDTLVESGASQGVDEVVIGMAHRGRLNVLAHMLHKPYEHILSEFEGAADDGRGDTEGDVKYHMGYSYDHVTEAGRKVHLSLSYNPSHLELVDPVIEGIVYAKQAYLRDEEGTRVVPVLVHGEAAFTGQGIVAETLNLSELNGYGTGGTIHIIINNQLGYTATPEETRFSPYPTDVAKQIQAPVFHVNADDPESVVQAARVAMEFRQRFKVDVIIDLWCYRRHGHNEADDPTLTQPLMYQQIAQHASTLKLYTVELVKGQRIKQEQVDELHHRVRGRLDEAQEMAKKLQVAPRTASFGGVWQGLSWATEERSVNTGVKREKLQRIAELATRAPEGFSLHRTVKRIVDARRKMAAGEESLDWGCAEMLAFGSLVIDGIPVRLAGQDSQRGTFAHRHAAWHDIKTGQVHIPLANMSPDQAEFVVLNTMLSELAVLGFEYGISSADPRRLVLWEAQFGDFVNGAQMIIDQFISSSEAKWQRMCGLVLLLPHGSEGMGPEHSSARLERFLQLCAKNNMQVAYPTTPAQFFHVLRRQMLRNFRKPLVLMTPKSLLRHKLCVSPLDELVDGTFHCVIDDVEATSVESVRRIVLCSGKVYYDLLEARRKAEGVKGDIALVRVEEIYPFPSNELGELLARYKRVEQIFWVQEEAKNMGAWSFVRPHLEALLPEQCALSYVGRDEAASPAAGSLHVHQSEQREIVDQALDMQAGEVVLSTVRRDGATDKERAGSQA